MNLGRSRLLTLLLALVATFVLAGPSSAAKSKHAPKHGTHHAHSAVRHHSHSAARHRASNRHKAHPRS